MSIKIPQKDLYRRSKNKFGSAVNNDQKAGV